MIRYKISTEASTYYIIYCNKQIKLVGFLQQYLIIINTQLGRSNLISLSQIESWMSQHNLWAHLSLNGSSHSYVWLSVTPEIGPPSSQIIFGFHRRTNGETSNWPTHHHSFRFVNLARWSKALHTAQGSSRFFTRTDRSKNLLTQLWLLGHCVVFQPSPWQPLTFNHIAWLDFDWTSHTLIARRAPHLYHSFYTSCDEQLARTVINHFGFSGNLFDFDLTLIPWRRWNLAGISYWLALFW